MAFRWLEVLHALYVDKLQSKDDCLVLVFHHAMINKGNKCVGIGDTWNQETDKASELLPPEWNSVQGNYSLRYVSEISNFKYLLKLTNVNEILLINVLDVSEGKAGGMSVKVDQHVGDVYSNYLEAYKDLNVISREFEKDVLEKIINEVNPSGKAEASKPAKKDSSSQHEESEERVMFSSRYSEPERHDRRQSFPSVGRDDLDPLGGLYGPPGGGGGGMLFDPRSLNRPRGPDTGIGGPRLPRGAIPPGARFDPFGPPRYPGLDPDPDHMLPPGFSDSFM